jgi:hypothetical protein
VIIKLINIKMAKKTEKKIPDAVDSFGDFEFVNPLKYQRAVDTVGTDDKEALLAEYDRLGGFIRHQGSKVINGAFWDKKTNSRVENPMPKVLKRQAAVIEETVEVVHAEVKKGKSKKEEEETVE